MQGKISGNTICEAIYNHLPSKDDRPFLESVWEFVVNHKPEGYEELVNERNEAQKRVEELERDVDALNDRIKELESEASR